MVEELEYLVCDVNYYMYQRKFDKFVDINSKFGGNNAQHFVS
jgi:hypothetical protein